MKSFETRGGTAIYNEDNTWSHPEPHVVKILENWAEFLRVDYTPALGFPREYFFSRVMEKMQGENPVNDEELPQDPGAIY